MNLEELLNPHLDRAAAIFCLVVFVITLVVLLATNAAGIQVQVYAITVPAAFVVLCRDMADDWLTTRKMLKEKLPRPNGQVNGTNDMMTSTGSPNVATSDNDEKSQVGTITPMLSSINSGVDNAIEAGNEQKSVSSAEIKHLNETSFPENEEGRTPSHSLPTSNAITPGHASLTAAAVLPLSPQQTNLESMAESFLVFLNARFPRTCHIISQLPFPLLPFTFGMFILVQGLVTKGWVQIFANGWERWVHATGTLGAIGGMGLVSVLLCNVSFAMV